MLTLVMCRPCHFRKARLPQLRAASKHPNVSRPGTHHPPVMISHVVVADLTAHQRRSARAQEPPARAWHPAAPRTALQRANTNHRLTTSFYLCAWPRHNPLRARGRDTHSPAQASQDMSSSLLPFPDEGQGAAAGRLPLRLRDGVLRRSMAVESLRGAKGYMISGSPSWSQTTSFA